MKKLNLFLATMMAIVLQGALAACAGNMHGDTMHNTGMQDTTMSGDSMHADPMTDTTKKEPKMMESAMTAMLSGSNGHHAVGEVSFIRQMGKAHLVLSNIDIEKVPDGHVYLAKNGNRRQGIDLGILRHFVGEASFALPAGTDPKDYDSVIIYCKKFEVEIGRAMLGNTM